MPLPPVTPAQTKLWASTEPREWKAALSQYDAAIRTMCKQKGKKAENLKALDDWYRFEFPDAISKRSPPKVEKAEMIKLMEWKLTRGKMRPLMHHIKGLKPEVVEAASETALRLASSLLKSRTADGEEEHRGPWPAAAMTQAMDALTKNLTGVGPATASALFAAACPVAFPFMSDEAMVVVLPSAPSAHTLARFLQLAAIFAQRAAALNQRAHNKASPPTGIPAEYAEWTASDVERALWAVSFAPPTATNDSNDDDSLVSAETRKRQAMVSKDDEAKATSTKQRRKK
mmetsp:Transcript_37378/g.62916  ORF Transcript_37378/g.62916 Transcript_37378/m.62916 type:complete len:287 (+) Transcript_37378:81-941(+)|eukprot:CAMPEP_0198223034 /NCGR_PEP_ID=MMETSP1445-20131203/90680_1 /TAXON_ID=36898 /ORGANISM="Pyramimonas sp., Strain CCMP2087" /LENGTH=286 /DNA_ID=CAMNT_0043901747 /DNA_START=33 /DNA_END=893 /DNA_ORIENTATION=+